MAAFDWGDRIDASTRLAILDSLLGEAPIGVGILDTELRYTAVNRFLADTNGVPVEAHVGRTLGDVLGEAGAALEPIIRGVLESGTSFFAPDFDAVTPAAPGVVRRFATSFHALRVDGITAGVMGVVVERTDAGAAVDVLRSSERRYRSLVEATSSVVWQVLPGEDSHEGWLASIHPDDRDRVRDAWMASLAELVVFDEECRIETPRGVRHVAVRAVPIVESGVLREWVGASTDITTTRSAQEALRTSEARLRIAVESGGMGTFDHDFRTGLIEWSAQTAAIFGMTLEDFDGQWTSFVSMVHPDDVLEIEGQLDGVVAELGVFHAEMRTWRDGGWNGRVLAQGQVVADADGHASRMIGIVVDVTQQRREAERVSEILESIADAFYALDRDWRFTYVNHEAASLLRRPAEELLGRSIWEEFPEARGTIFEESYRRAAEQDEVVAFQTYYPPLDGWFDLRAFPSPGGVSVYFRNIDDERAAERERLTLEDQRAAAAARTARLGQVASALTEALSEDDVSRLVLKHACDAVGARGGGVAVFDADGKVLRWSAVDGYTQEQQEDLWRSPLDVDRPLTRVVRTRQPEYLSTADDLTTEFPAVGDVFTRLGDHALCSIPLVAGGRCLGGMTLTFAAAREFPEEDRLLLAALADTSAQALERARLYEREHRVAETLQRALLPERLAQPGAVDSAARYLPGTEGVAVGGDWYDVFDLGQNRLGIALGDVVGKGVAAAAVMGRLRNALRAFATSIDGPAEVLTRVDDFVDRFSGDDLATLVYGVLDVGTGELRFSSAGHLPPLRVGADGAAAFLPQEPDVPVGVAADDGRSEHRVRLAAGDTLVLYSDGLVEDRTRSIDEGLAELAAIGAETAGEAEVEALCGRIVERLVGAGGADDVAVLVLRWAGPPSSDRCSIVLPPDVASSRRARALLAEELERWGESGLTETAALCLSEVVTNAVVHAGTPVHLDILLQPDRVRVEVADGGAAPPERVEADPEAVHGRGIAIVEMLSAGWGVEHRDEGKCVWFELERSP